MFTIFAWGVHGEVGYTLREEDACLIIAAPDMEDVCNKVASRPVEIQELMRREDIVLDNLDDRMQKFAFTLYTMLATDAGLAERAIAKAKG
jgi:hypothetical protein